MVNRLLGLCSGTLGAVWLYRWEFIRAWIWETIHHMLTSYLSDRTIEEIAHYGPPTALAALTVFLFWKSGQDQPVLFRRIPFHAGAIKAYEAAEKAGVLGQYVRSNDAPEKAIWSLKTYLMVHDGIELFGAKPPSTNVNVIPKAALQGGELTPVEGTKDELFPILPLGADPTYVNVVVGARGLRRLIKEIRAEGRGR